MSYELDDLKRELEATKERLRGVEEGMRARSDAERWAADNPEFYQCRANASAIAEKIQELGLPFVYESYAAAYAAIKDKLEKAPEDEAQPQEQPEKAKLGKADKEFLSWADSLSASDFQRQVIGNRENFARYNKLTAHQAVKVGS